jgi:hypothetical protein
MCGFRVRGERVAGTLTVTLAMDRIRQNIGVTWKESTIDGVKAGDRNASVSGVAVTAMATMDMLARAVRENTNLVVSLEPVYFSRSVTTVTRNFVFLLRDLDTQRVYRLHDFTKALAQIAH